jgi:NADPH2:quinone reductase
MRSKLPANELFEVVASGEVRINVNRRFALKDAVDAHKALEARNLGLHHPDRSIHRSSP